MSVDLPKALPAEMFVNSDFLYFFPFFRDRVRTAVNVIGDCYCAGVMSHWLQDEFDKSEENQVVTGFNN